MITKCGIDMLLDNRIKKSLENINFIKRIYHKSEIHNKDIKKLASIFALKEAVFKALDISSENWLKIEVSYSKTRRPLITLSNEIKPNNLISLDCSVTHENGITQAIVIMLLDEE